MNKHFQNTKQALAGSKKNILLTFGVVALLTTSAYGGYVLGYHQANKQNLSSVQSSSSDDKKSTNDTDLADDSKDIETDLGEGAEDGVSKQESVDEEQPQETSNLEPTYEVKTVGESLEFEIRPKGAAPAYYVDYRLSGEVVALGDAVDIGIIDSSGRYRNIAGLIISSNNPREGQVRIPFQVYDCSFSETYNSDKTCGNELVDISKGVGAFVVTHAPTNEIDISAPIEIL